ncbi:MAG: hypothetical protein NTY36_03395 [Deltaproteobacteria bacterium]|nr:hypothetical protein [Deltaproteobacteria bacterium]
MGTKNQKFSGKDAIKRAKNSGHPGPGFRIYRVKAGPHGTFRILAESAESAEFIGRNLLGAELIYREPRGPEDIDKVIKALMDPGGIFGGDLEVEIEA